MKDIVAHLTGWNRKLVSHLDAAVRRVPEPPPPWSPEIETEDDINAWIYEANRRRSVQEVLDESNQVHQQLVAVVEAIPDTFRFDRVEPKYLIVWVDDERIPICEFFDHFEDEHESDVRAWLTRIEQQKVPSDG